MSNPVRAIPEGYHSITPGLTCKDAARAMDFYKQIFGATEIMRMPGPNGQVMHGELRIGDSVIFVSDEFPGMSCAPTPGATNPVSIFMYTENVDATLDRKSTRLNSSHSQISYAVFCLKKKKNSTKLYEVVSTDRNS